jgi:membrane-bound lytic murein transglycosylase A
MPLPDPRPSEKIAKLFPPADHLKDRQKDQKNDTQAVSAAPGSKDPPKAAIETGTRAASTSQPLATAAPVSAGQTAAAVAVPLPLARPHIEPVREGRWQRPYRRYRRDR